jgi:hypothetical protein
VLKFGIIAEGPTDQKVIESILLGYFADQEDEPAVNYVEPPRPEVPGGWANVFSSLKLTRHEEALQFNDFLVIHIDTDVQEEPGFDVPRRAGGKELSVSDRIDRVIARLKTEIAAEFYHAYAHRILFAIAVDSIECWLLPLLYDKKKAAKTNGCLESANRALRKINKDALSAGEKKFFHAYEKASSGYRKRKTLIDLRGKNPSLELFIKQLDALPNGSAANVQSDSEI